MRRTALQIALLVISSVSSAANLSFHPVPGFDRAEGGSSLAFEAGAGKLAVGDTRGVWLRDADGVVRRALGTGPVHDLAFTQGGSLLAATERGLFEIGRDRRVKRHTLAPGAAGRARRLLLGPRGWLVATDDGISVARPGGPFRALDGALPSGEVSALAWQAESELLFAIIAGDLYEIRLSESEGSPIVLGAVREPLLGAGGLPLDLGQDADTGAVLLLRERALALRGAEGWQSERLVLPPGITPLRIASGGSGQWIATDAGLLGRQSPDGRFERVAGAVGQAAASAVVVAGERAYVATLRGVFLGAPADAAPPLRPDRPMPDFEGEPSVGAVQRVALRYLDLEAARFLSLQERVRRRGFFPELEIGGDYGGFRASDRDQDEIAFSSGGRHLLLDRLSEKGRDFGVGAKLSWDFSGPVYDPEEIDVSKEVRELIELRDEVLDEINQLYFERRRALLERAALDEPESLEGERLRLRASELAAGLDAWTGGWWSGQLRAAAAPPRAPDPTPDGP
jgi:hypothetical protein